MAQAVSTRNARGSRKEAPVGCPSRPRTMPETAGVPKAQATASRPISSLAVPARLFWTSRRACRPMRKPSLAMNSDDRLLKRYDRSAATSSTLEIVDHLLGARQQHQVQIFGRHCLARYQKPGQEFVCIDVGATDDDHVLVEPGTPDRAQGVGGLRRHAAEAQGLADPGGDIHAPLQGGEMAIEIGARALEVGVDALGFRLALAEVLELLGVRDRVGLETGEVLIALYLLPSDAAGKLVPLLKEGTERAPEIAHLVEVTPLLPFQWGEVHGLLPDISVANIG